MKMRSDRIRDLDPVNLAPLQLGKKRGRIHDNRGNVNATRFSCTNSEYVLRRCTRSASDEQRRNRNQDFHFLARTR